MESISLNQYLSISNVWTRRLLGYELFNKKRDVSAVEKEYNLDKYSKLLALDLPDMEHYKIMEFEQAGLSDNDRTYISFQESIFSTKLSISRNIFYQIIKGFVGKYRAKYYCELGCGYGFNLSYLDGKGYGGEYAENAVRLANKLGMDVRKFNYYNIEDYELIRDRSTVFTVHSLEQIPDATCFIEGISSQRDKIDYIINIEPSIIDERTTLLGLLRNKYIEINDYNRNLFSLLRGRDDVEILELEYDVIGFNPLNSANVIAWKFNTS